MSNRAQFHNMTTTKQMSSPGAQPNTDRGLGAFTTHNRIGKQTASGDTGDNNLTCEHSKRSTSEESATDSQTNKAIHVHPSANCQKILTSGMVNLTSKVTGPSAIANLPENRTNLIINYLPPNMSQEEVRALFSSIGEVESCKLVREKTSGESLGYAFVKFYDPLDAGKAIKTLNGLRLQNKTVKVSLARPSSEAIKGANLYICGLPRKMTQVELEKLFGTCGHIITARILYDTKTGLSRGVAFIRYDQRTEAEIAIRRLNGYLPPAATEQITVKFANSPSSNRGENMNLCFMKSADGDNIPRYQASSGVSSVSSPMRTGTNDDIPNSATCRSQDGASGLAMSMQSRISASSKTSGMVGELRSQNVGYLYPANRTAGNHSCTPSINTCNFADTAETSTNTFPTLTSNCPQNQGFLNGFPLSLTNVGLNNNFTNNCAEMMNPVHRLTGGAVRLKCQAAAAAAVAVAAISNSASMGLRASNHMLNSSMVPKFPTGLPNFGTDMMRNFGSSAQALLAPAFAASSGALTATGWCIFVYNLSPDMEESILWQLFGPFGAVQTVKVIRDPNTTKCKGFGFVTMSNYEEALLAIHSLNGFNLGNRVLQVSFKTTPNSRQMKYMAQSSSDIALVTGLTGSLTPVPSAFPKSS